MCPEALEEESLPVEHQLQFIRFVVNDTPHACWEWNLRERNLQFLQGIDPEYFEYVAQANAEHLDGDNKHRAALAVRVAYSQAQETLFALLGAMVQAPECVIGWLLAYRNSELEDLVRKLSSHQDVLTRLRVVPTWTNLSRIVHDHLGYDAAKKQWIAEGYAKAWSRFAHEFLNEKASSEYNSIKHGLRARLGGFTLSVGIEDVPGQPARPEAMRSLGGSLYGTSYYTIEKLGEGRTNFRARQHSRNWVPDNLLNGLHLLSWSIGNVVSFLRILNGTSPGDCRFHNPNSPDAFDEPWTFSTGVTDCSFDLTLEADQITPRSKQEILDSYRLPLDYTAYDRSRT